MTQFRKFAAFLLATALISTAMAPCAMAASKQKVGRIDLTVDSDIRIGSSGGYVEVTPTGSNTGMYYVDDVEITNEDDNEDWSRSNPPEISVLISIEDEDEYAFSGTGSSNFRLTMGSSTKSHFDQIKFVGATKKDNGATIVLKFKLVFDKDADIRSIAAPGNLKWSDSQKGTATWEDVAGAKYFQVQLYRDGNLVNDTSVSDNSIQSVYATSCDYSKYLTVNGKYQFKARSVRSSNNAKSDWASSDILTVTDGSTSTGTSGDNSQTSTGEGWQKTADNRWWWRNADGSYPTSQWKEVNGQWYYFDAEGYMATGWITLNGVSYYLDTTSGAMYSNCRTPDNYWVNESGAWVPGV